MDHNDLQNSLNYYFKNENLLTQAMSHPSLKQFDNNNYDNERLEFLGDSVIGFLITEILYNKFSEYNEGKLAKFKSYLVSKQLLAEIADNLSLQAYIIMTSGEEKTGGRENINNIENAFEALIGAIYLDSNIETTREIVTNLWQDHLVNINLDEIDSKSALQELAQEKYAFTPIYNLIEKKGPAHQPIFKVRVRVREFSCEDKGTSIKEAEKKAAAILYNKLKLL